METLLPKYQFHDLNLSAQAEGCARLKRHQYDIFDHIGMVLNCHDITGNERVWVV